MNANANTAKQANPCLPESTPGYTSANPQADWQRFQDAMRAIVAVPKEAVDEAMEAEKEKRAVKRGAK